MDPQGFLSLCHAGCNARPRIPLSPVSRGNVSPLYPRKSFLKGHGKLIARTLTRLEFLFFSSEWGNGKTGIVCRAYLKQSPWTVSTALRFRFSSRHEECGSVGHRARLCREACGHCDTTLPLSQIGALNDSTQNEAIYLHGSQMTKCKTARRSAPKQPVGRKQAARTHVAPLRR